LVWRLAHAFKTLKKHPAHWRKWMPFFTELCVRSCSASPFWYTQGQDGNNKKISSILGKIGVPKRVK